MISYLLTAGIFLLLSQPSLAENWAWTKETTWGQNPGAREGHSTTRIDRTLYVFGGCKMDLACFNDLYTFDTKLRKWSLVEPKGDVPSPRGGHTATVIGTDIYIFGGASNEGSFQDVYKFDTVARRWLPGVPKSDFLPTPRSNHAAATDGEGRIYVHGGFSQEGSYLDDMWIVNVFPEGDDAVADSFPFIFEKPVSESFAPPARESHTLTEISNRLYLIGGYTIDGLKDHDLWVYLMDEQKWQKPTIQGPFPGPRQAHAAERHGKDIVLTGGCDVTRDILLCYNDVWSFDTVGMKWNLQSNQTETMSPREGHTATFVRGKMYVFGGCKLSSACFDDLLVLNTGIPCPNACGGSDHGTCWDRDSCSCKSGWTGHDCMSRQTCPFACNGRGKCSNGKCSCDSGYVGQSCYTEVPCPNKCSGHGVCTSNATCNCYNGYHGPGCELGSPICPNSCSGHGICMQNSSCKCEQGWIGESCSQPDLCPFQCCGRGTCSNGRCTCDLGWNGDACNLPTSRAQEVEDILSGRSKDLHIRADGKRSAAQTTRELAMVTREQMKATMNDRAKNASLEKTALYYEGESEKLLAAALEYEKEAANLDDVRSPKDIHKYLDMSTCTSSVTSPVSKHANVLTSSASDGSAKHSSALSSGMTESEQNNNYIAKPSAKVEGGDCKNNCSDHGICKDKVCYCEPSYFGEDCSLEGLAGPLEVSFPVFLALCIGTLILSAAITGFVIHHNVGRRRMLEEEMGYAA